MKSLLVSRRKPPPKSQTSLPVADDTIQPQDILSHLPFELLLLILQHFSTPAHILALLNVCRAWRDAALSPEIWPSLADRCAPGLVAHLRAAYPPEAQSEAFHLTLRQTHLQDQGYFTDITHQAIRLNLKNDDFFTISKSVPISQGGVHSLDAVVGLDPTTEEDHVSRLKLYSHGRVAWWPEAWHLPFFAVIDDLRTRTRRMYIYPNQNDLDLDRQKGWKTAMGELLFVMGQENVGVCVWHLERDEMREIKLPGAVNRCIVQGERLLFVGRARAEVWCWSWDSNAVDSIDVASQGCYTPGPVTIGGQIVLGNPRPSPRVGLRFRATDQKLDFILHPTDPDVFFVVTFDEDNVDFVVSEVTSGIVTARIPLPPGHIAYRILRFSRSNDTVRYLRYEKCDARGGYCLMTVHLSDSNVCDAPFCGSGLGSICFNVYTKQFSAFVHHAVYNATPETHLWDGKLMVGIDGELEGATSPKQRRPFVAVLKPCDAQPATSLTVFGSIPSRDPTLDARLMPSQDGMRHRPSRLERVSYVLAAKNRSWHELAEANSSARGLDILDAEWFDGDDKTLLYVIGKEYTFWTFGDDDNQKSRKGDKKDVASWRERWKNRRRARGESRARA